MEEYISARDSRAAEWESLTTAYHNITKKMNDEWKKFEKGHKELQAKKEELAKKNGGSDVDDSDRKSSTRHARNFDPDERHPAGSNLQRSLGEATSARSQGPHLFGCKSQMFSVHCRLFE